MPKSSFQIASEKASFGMHPNQARAEKKFGSVFFLDMVDFTSRCESYTPSDVVEQVNTIFQMVTKTIHKYSGDIDKFMGDACMSYWISNSDSENTLDMVEAFFEIKKEVIDLNKTNPSLINDKIALRYGMNSGEVILCDIGSPEARIDLTIIGDTVNLASRLESANKQYGSTNLISEKTKGLIESRWSTREIDSMRVYGKEIPVKTFEVIEKHALLNESQKKKTSYFEEGKEFYIQGDFKKAESFFMQSLVLEENYPKGLNPSVVFIRRTRYLEKNKPKDWTGILTLTSK